MDGGKPPYSVHVDYRCVDIMVGKLTEPRSRVNWAVALDSRSKMDYLLVVLYR